MSAKQESLTSWAVTYEYMREKMAQLDACLAVRLDEHEGELERLEPASADS